MEHDLHSKFYVSVSFGGLLCLPCFITVVCFRVKMTASAAWSDLKSRNVGDCVDLYLSRAQEIPLYGCRLFKAQVWQWLWRSSSR